MTNKVNQLPPSPREDPLEESPSRDGPSDHMEAPGMDANSPLEKEVNIMTHDDLGCLREDYSFLDEIQIRIPEEGETVLSARPGEVAFYEAVFPADLRFLIHPTIRRILTFYNICLTQLSPNTW